MGEINHFIHQEHSLKFIENLEVIVGICGDNDQKKGFVVHCHVCQEPMLGGSAYGCITCHYFLHTKCIELRPTINHHIHPPHPLILVNHGDLEWTCDACGKDGWVGGFSYHCVKCNFDACTKCGVVVAHKEEALIKFQHEGHPQHTLILQSRSASFLCDACHSKDEGLFYQCEDCDFWIHKTCTSLAPTINLHHHHKHPLVLVYSLPDNFYKFDFFCEFCDRYIHRNGWMYHCANCRYFAHIKCALNAMQPPVSSDELGTSVAEECANNFLQLPMSYALKDPLKLLHLEKMGLDDDRAREINHWSHDHPLIFNIEPHGNINNIGCRDPIEVCYGCVRPLSLPYYSCKDGCLFTLHKYCAELPLTLEHQLHPDHSLDLVDAYEDEDYYICNGCFSNGNRFAYTCETCKFYLDVNCAFLPNTIKHKSHKHPLIQVIDPNTRCKACFKLFDGISFACKACKFRLDVFCAVCSPHFLTHRYCKGHEIPLTYPPVEDHPEDFYCDICEEEMHPKHPQYHCHKCKNSFHLKCINRIDRYANVKEEGTIIVSYHKHPLMFARREKTAKYVCFVCSLDVNGRLILECQTGTCPFRICQGCHLKELE